MKFNLKLKKNEIKVGLFILFPFVVLFILILFKLGYSLSSSTYDIYLKIDNINSIKVGTPIKIKGYLIGRVVDIRPVYEPALHFLAVMRLNSDVTLNESCTAVIMNQNVIGDPVIDIRNPERKEKSLVENDVIEGVEFVNIEALLQDVHSLLSSTESVVSVVKDMSEESRGNIRKLTSNLASSVASVNTMLQNSQKDFGDILVNFRKFSQTVQEVSEEFKAHPVKFLTK